MQLIFGIIDNRSGPHELKVSVVRKYIYIFDNQSMRRLCAVGDRGSGE